MQTYSHRQITPAGRSEKEESRSPRRLEKTSFIGLFLVAVLIPVAMARSSCGSYVTVGDSSAPEQHVSESPKFLPNMAAGQLARHASRASLPAKPCQGIHCGGNRHQLPLGTQWRSNHGLEPVFLNAGPSLYFPGEGECSSPLRDDLVTAGHPRKIDRPPEASSC